MDSQQPNLQSPSDPVTGTPARKKPWYIPKRLIMRLAGLYVILIILLLSFETLLVYPGSAFSLGKEWNEATFQHEEIEFESADGTKLVGWYLDCVNADYTVLLFHGNGEDAARASSYLGRMLRQNLNARVFVFDYRGFGKSEGSPFEKGILEDSEAAMKWLNQKTGTVPSDVMLVGHSIGGGPAVHIAATMGCQVMVLQRTFNSLVEAAQSRYWFVPVNYLMRNRYPSGEKIANCTMPLFQSHGTEDSIVPIESGQRLFAASPSGHKEFFVFEGGTHFTYFNGDYWVALKTFLADHVGDDSNHQVSHPKIGLR